MDGGCSAGMNNSERYPWLRKRENVTHDG